MKDYSGIPKKLMERGLQVTKASAAPLEKRSDEAADEVKAGAPRIAAE